MNKTAMQTLIEWGYKMMLEHSMKTLSFAEAIDKAVELLEMEKQQIMKAYGQGIADEAGEILDATKDAQQYYKETFKSE